MAIFVPRAPPPTSPGRSRNLAAVRRRDTEPEKRVRSLLHAQGLRFRVDHPIRVGSARPIRPDVVFTRHQVAVFIDGCYFHGCSEHGRGVGGANEFYWGPKIARNQERDREQAALLTSEGWRVMRFWEHEPPGQVAEAVRNALRHTG